MLNGDNNNTLFKWKRNTLTVLEWWPSFKTSEWDDGKKKYKTYCTKLILIIIIIIPSKYFALSDWLKLPG